MRDPLELLEEANGVIYKVKINGKVINTLKMNESGVKLIRKLRNRHITDSNECP